MKVAAFIKKYTMVLALVIVFIFFSALTNGKLLYAQNISNLLLQNAYVLVTACGMLLCILTGGNVDLSIGSTICFAAAAAAKAMSLGAPAGAGILLALVIGAGIGIMQGWLIGYIHIPPFICTLAGMFLWRGVGRTILNSKTIAIQDKGFLNLFTSYIQIPGLDRAAAEGEAGAHYVSAIIVGVIISVALIVYTIYSLGKQKKSGHMNGKPIAQIVKILVIDVVIIAYSIKLSQYKGIPVMLIWILIVVLIFAFLTSSTVFGRYFYAVGGNEKATKLSGIDPRRVYFVAYFLMSLLASFAGLLSASRLGSVNGDLGNSYEMDAIASCFIGGASAYGGSGTVPGVMIGAILLGVINQGMSIYGLPDQYQYIVKGAVLLAAVIFDVVSNKKTGKS